MKYIRTKDGIIEINPTLTNEQIDISLGKNTPRADTVEELCDGYVIEHPINAFKFFYNKEDMEIYLFNTCMRMFDLHELKVYSVIKTSKGLIYAAKMNDKRELVLL